jgi:hypothetical protein
MSALGLGCVKTCAGEEDAELHSLLSSPDGVHQRCCFSNRQNRDKLSIRKFNFGVFTQPGSRPSHSTTGLTFVCCYSKSDYSGLGSGRSRRAKSRHQESRCIGSLSCKLSGMKGTVAASAALARRGAIFVPCGSAARHIAVAHSRTGHSRGGTLHA